LGGGAPPPPPDAGGAPPPPDAGGLPEQKMRDKIKLLTENENFNDDDFLDFTKANSALNEMGEKLSKLLGD